MLRRSCLQNIFAVAIAADDKILLAHFQVDARMAERAATAVAGDARVTDLDDLCGADGFGAGGFKRHVRPGLAESGGIIASDWLTARSVVLCPAAWLRGRFQAPWSHSTASTRRPATRAKPHLATARACPSMRSASQPTELWTKPMP